MVVDKWHYNCYNIASWQYGGTTMIVQTRIFELCKDGTSYRNLSELAQAMGISVSQVYRVREGKRHINQKFIVGAIKAFPSCTLDELFYLVLEPAKTNQNHRSWQSATRATDQPAAIPKVPLFRPR